MLGARSLFLEVRVSNTVAQQLYRKAGFKEISRRGRYYSDPAEDAIVFGLDLERAGRLDGSASRTVDRE
ncbi:MAG: hypothetical protein A2Z06_01255 [Candidatus Glassbacteria bacterium RBG_16_58_8]|uniref:N-acetyltransferase domain-containing protein n=1 Tax=Candidatus Glassbacteria bacterium RBG_16_58_8 TaxID=1817866 RepID=A0A1F5YBJ0_9BACT|nr:MAG: hypothetical protein A2Z06_01255 [Candidatus Glassbacteria bacterium RBG_16_58_8]